MYHLQKRNYFGSTGIDDPYVGCEHAIWMQFTGLQDKNGEDIYEGDILKTDKNENWVAEVKYIPGAFIASIPEKIRGVSLMERVQPLSSFVYDHYGWEVIGNTFQNPELLNHTV